MGAPHGDYGAALAPADLARRFVCAAISTNGVFWLLLGSVSGLDVSETDLRLSQAGRPTKRAEN